MTKSNVVGTLAMLGMVFILFSQNLVTELFEEFGLESNLIEEVESESEENEKTKELFEDETFISSGLITLPNSCYLSESDRLRVIQKTYQGFLMEVPIPPPEA